MVMWLIGAIVCGGMAIYIMPDWVRYILAAFGWLLLCTACVISFVELVKKRG
jgi:hypothetical protein